MLTSFYPCRLQPDLSIVMNALACEAHELLSVRGDDALKAGVGVTPEVRDGSADEAQMRHGMTVRGPANRAGMQG